MIRESIRLPLNHFCFQHKNEALKKGSLTKSTASDTKIRLSCFKLIFIYIKIAYYIQILIAVF